MDITKMDAGTITLLGAAGGVMLSMQFTIQVLSQHLFYWKNPKEQKAIITIILLAPLYAIASFAGVLDIENSRIFFKILIAIKECYEAMVIAKFMVLMYSYLNISTSTDIVPAGIRGREIQYSFPISLFLPRRIRLENHTLKLLKYWIRQFEIVRPVCSVLMLTLPLLGLYPNWVRWTLTVILTISVSMTTYALVIFYHFFAKELSPHKPVAKFLCISGVIFLCFWQGVALDALAAAGVIQSHHFWLKVDHAHEALHCVLVIVEMVFFTVMQQYAYHIAPYKRDGQDVKSDKDK